MFLFVQGTAMHQKQEKTNKKSWRKKKEAAEADHYPFFADFMAQE